MHNESDFKRAFCDNVATQKGYTFKIAMSSMSGLPDLYCAMPNYIPLMLEAKWLKDIPSGTFKRKIPYRPFQREILKNCNKVYKEQKVAYCLLGLDLGEHKYCMLLDPDIQIITHDILHDENFELVSIRKIDKEWFIDIDLLFKNCDVPYRVRMD